MTTINVASLNINSLNGQVKWSTCLDFLKRQEIDAACIQESHLAIKDNHRYTNRHYYTAAAASLNSKSYGVLVVLKHNLSANIIETYGNSDGHIACDHFLQDVK